MDLGRPFRIRTLFNAWSSLSWLLRSSTAGSLRDPLRTSLEGVTDPGEVFAVLGARVRSAVRRVLRSAVRAVREALRLAPLVTGFVEDLFRSDEHREQDRQSAQLHGEAARST